MSQLIYSSGRVFEVTKKDERPKYTHTLEQAMEEAQFGKCQIILTLIITFALLGSTIESVNLSFILPYAKCDLGLSTREQGLLSGISFLGFAATPHLWGFLADTWGRKKVLQLVATVGFIFSFSSAFASNTISMIFLRFAAGALFSGTASAGYSYITEFHSSSTAPRSAAFITIGFCAVLPFVTPLAMLIMPMDWEFSLYFVEFRPWRLFLMFLSLFNLFIAIIFVFIPESPKFLLAMNRKDEALEVLGRVYAINTGRSANDYPVHCIESVTLGNSISDAKGAGDFFRLIWKQTVPIFQKPMLTNTCKLSYIIFVVFAISNGTFMWLPHFLHQLKTYNGKPKIFCDILGPDTDTDTNTNSTNQLCGIDNKNIEPFQLLFVAGLFYMFMAIITVFYLKKIAPKTIVCGWLIVSMMCGVLMDYVDNFYVIVICLVAFVCCGVCSSIVMAVAVNLYPTNCRAMATSFIMMAGRLGSVSGSNFIGFMLENYCTWIFYVFGGILISCALVFMMVKIKSQ